MDVGKGWESEEGFLEAVRSRLFQLETLVVENFEHNPEGWMCL